MKDMGSRQSTVAVFAALFPPAYLGGGPIRSVESLVDSSPAEIESLVFTSDHDLGASARLDVPSGRWVDRGGAKVYYVDRASPVDYWRALRSLRARKPDLLHFNSFMNPFFTIIPMLLWRIGFWGRAQLLLSPRGEFGDAALTRRSTKKRVYIAVFRALGLGRAVIWHSTAQHESADIRALWGARARIIERPNDTLLPPIARPPKHFADASLRVAFLGRLVPHKGLDIVLEALGSVSTAVILDVYGSSEDAAYVGRCRVLADGLPEHVNVVFHGPIRPDEVMETLADHEVLLMPSAGENFGHVIAEALAASCVVVTTRFTPWSKTLADGGGAIVERTPAAWQRAIEELALAGSPARRDRRLAAAAAYARWREQQSMTHLWQLAFESMAGSVNGATG